jgi:hypothetical protein
MLARTALFAYADAAQKLKLKQTMSLIRELKRRNVFRVGVAYVVTAWLLIQVTDVVLNNTAAPDWVFSVIMLVLGLGFPVVLIFAWAFEMTPEGIKREKDVDRGQSITRQTRRRPRPVHHPPDGPQAGFRHHRHPGHGPGLLHLGIPLLRGAKRKHQDFVE